MKFAFSSNGFRKFSLLETIDALGEIGYQGIEIMADRPHAYPPDLDSSHIGLIKESLKRWNMEVSNINAFMLTAIGDFHHPSWIEREKEKREIRIQHTIDCIRLAANLGARSISTEPGGPLDGINEGEAKDMFLEGIQRAGRYAAEEGVYLLIEPEPGLLIEKSSQMKDFFSLIENEWIRLNCDLGHFYCVEEDPAQVVQEMAIWIEHFHLEDIAADRKHEHLMLGQGCMDIQGILKKIEEISYNGFITVELYPFQDDPIGTAAKSLEYLREISGK